MDMKITVAFFFMLFCDAAVSQTIVPLTSGTNTSIRGLSVVNDSVAWVSGSNGWSARTTDGGKNWKWLQIKGYEKFDFRDIEAFSAGKAIVVNAGSPAVILLTADGGDTWKEVYRNSSPHIFLDGMDFWNADAGIVYGDPIGGILQLFKTNDGGKTWIDISHKNRNTLIEGEASFAASGTNIRTLMDGECWIATGGTQSRIFYSPDYGDTWRVYPCPIIQGSSSTGPFSIAFRSVTNGVAAGGDYLRDTVTTNNFLITRDGGKTWAAPVTKPFGYRSSVEFITEDHLVATGTSGTDISVDGGRTWNNISPEGFHVVRRAKSGKLLLLSGSNGRIACLRF
ncbi:MAG TPA: YCF48-related protein [Sphingobacteriaceae bacterium]